MATSLEQAERYKRPRFEMLPTGGWRYEVVDHAQNPPVVVGRKFLQTDQIAGIFVKGATIKTGIMEKPIGLCALAIGAGYGMYLFVDPGGIRPILLYTGAERTREERKPMALWVPPAAWIFKAPSGATNKWTAKVALLAPTRDGNVFSPDSRIGQYPMSNTYNHYGICWGNVKLPALRFPEQCRRAVESFFQSDFNGHVWCLQNNFFDHVRSFGTKHVIKEMTEEERWNMLIGTLPGNFLTSNLTAFWENELRTGARDMEDNDGGDEL